MAAKLYYFIFDLIFPLIVGYILRRRSDNYEPLTNRLMLLNLYFLFPLAGLLSFWVIRLEASLIFLPLAGVLMQTLAGFLGYQRVKKFSDPLERGSYLLACILSNRGVIGSLSVFFILGETGYALARLAIVLESVVLYSFCFPLSSYYYRKNGSVNNTDISLKTIFLNKSQIPLAGLILGFFLAILQIPRPRFFAELFNILVHVSAWFALIPVGYSIDFIKINNYLKKVWDVVAIKFLATPVVVLLITIPLMNNNLNIFVTLMVLAFAPTGINAVVTAKIHKLNIHVAMGAFILTTVVYLLIVYPLVFLGFNYLLL